MSKRSIRDIILNLVVKEKKILVGQLPTKQEVDLLSNLLEPKKKSLFNDFIIALGMSRYATFMIGGKLGKELQDYYRAYYTDLLLNDLIKHFIELFNRNRPFYPDFDHFTVFMTDIFTHIYAMFFSEKVFLGHYLLHSNTLAITSSKLIIIKYNNRYSENKRVTVFYDYETERIDNGATKIITVHKPKFDKNAKEMVSIVSSDYDTISLDFDNQLYRHSLEKNEIKIILNNEMKPIDYHTNHIIIKGLYANRLAVFILTTDGQVYIMGNCMTTIGHKAIEMVDENFMVKVTKMITLFAPIKINVVISPEDIPHIVHIYPHESGKTFLVDSKNRIYMYDWNFGQDADGFNIFSDSYNHKKLPITISFNLDAMQAMIIDISNDYAIDKDKKIYDLNDFGLKVEVTTVDNPFSGELEEFYADYTKVLLFQANKGKWIVCLNNQKTYIFTKMEGLIFHKPPFVLRSVVYNNRVLWNEKEKIADLWIFQCDYCNKISSQLKQDYNINATVCDQKCQKALYEREFLKITNQ
jgi:hypothetical protein